MIASANSLFLVNALIRPYLGISLKASTAYKDWLFRVSNTMKPFLIVLISFSLISCSSLSGDWPNLAEPFPDASDRNRVIERVNPTPPPTVQDNGPLTRSTAFKLMESTRARLKNATTTYLAIKAKIAPASGEDKTDYWNEAQLALTRLSHTASRLDTILFSEKLKPAPVWASATALKNAQDLFLVAERKSLATLKP